MSTKDQILSLLRRDALTVSELSERLDISRNGVIVPLKQLEASKLISGMRRKRNGAGKPAIAYAAVAGREDIASSAYPAYAETMLQVLAGRMTREQVSAFMDDVGRELAAKLSDTGASCFPDRLKAAAYFVDNVGAETVVEHTERGAVVKSFSCPLARAVRREPCVCSSVASFFASVTGAKVQEKCNRGDRLQCVFEITDIDAAA